ATLSGAAVFLSFDGNIFELVEQDQDPATFGFQPFAPGGFFNNGEIYRNALLAPDDPAASPTGEQLDYSVVRAADTGSGPAASFQLRALAPAAGSRVRIDESGIRETRYFKPDGTHQSFRFITPLTIDVHGISLEGLPSELVLSRGQIDSTSFALDQILFDPLYAPQDISWHVDATAAVDVHIDTQTRHLIIAAPADRSLWEQLTLRAMNPDGQTASAPIDLFVNAGPVLMASLDTLEFSEDGTHRLSLDALVDDPDDPDAQLLWTLIAPAELGARLEGPPHELIIEPLADWHGSGQLKLTTMDRFGFADSAAMNVRVLAVNDVPQSLYSPNLRITRGKTDSSLSVASLFADVDDDLAQMEMSWTGAERTRIARRGGRMVITAPDDWEGSEAIQLTIVDAQGAAATAPLTITVVASLAPAVTGAPQRLGVAVGEASVLDLKQFITDPDDPTTDLSWSVVGQVELLIQVSTTGAVRIEAPAGFAGTETIRFSAIDPSGESAHFDLLVFGAPATGAPLVAPLPAIELPPGGVNASVDLDDFVFDLDHEPQQMSWSATGPAGLELRIDSISHVLTVIASDSLGGDYAVDLRVMDPDGHEVLTAVPVRVTSGSVVDPVEPPTATPLSLSPLPTLHMSSGGFDQTLVLDGYVQSGDPASVRWEAISGEHVQVLIDNATRRVTVLAEDGWSGPALITIRALDAAGDIITESFFGVQVEAALAALSLQDLVEVAVLQGDSLLSFDPASLLATGP
ncbi:MAG: Ig-like domain-containing protein, partial [Gemmatimonadetes bacterium]|nr:Ig-like domain-containing protein [Gemmatimonadota bacterium]